MTIHSDKSFWTFVKASAWIVAIVAIMGMGSCVDDSVALSAVADQGFTDARIRSRSDFFSWANGCDGTDKVAWQVDAKREGRSVRLTVCAGAIWKGATVRSAHR